jgi:hypothetical protein
MASTINAITTGVGGIVATGDTSGVIELQSSGTAIATVSSTGMTVTGTLSSSGASTFAAGTAAAPAITTTGDTNTGMFFPAADTIAFAEGGAEAMRLDSAGNVGIGVTPSPSVLSGKVLEIGFSGGNANMFQNGVDDWWFSSNAYYNGSSWVYNKTGTISQYHMANGTHVWLNQVSGTAGTSASAPVERMRIDSSGNLLFNSGYGSVATAYGCRAWVNFNGTGTLAVRGSANVSSVSDNGSGLYQVNFTTAIVDNNYTTVVTARRTDGGGGSGGDINVLGAVLGSGSLAYSSSVTTTSVKVGTGTVSGLGSNDQDCFVAIFR